MRRREFLLTTTALIGAAGLAACVDASGGKVVVNLDLSNLVQALLNDLPLLAILPGVPAGLIDMAQHALALLGDIKGLMSGGSAESLKSAVSAVLPVLIGLLGPAATIIGMGTPIGLGLMAASLLLPVIASAFGISMPSLPGARAQRGTTMTLDQARAIVAARAHPER